MKLRIIYTFFALSLGAFIFFSNANGRAASQGMGNTGAPGDEMIATGPRTCQTCHNNGTFTITNEFLVTDAAGTPIETVYTPGEEYTIKMIINSPEAAAYGFQAVALGAPIDADGPSINTWVASSANAQVAVALNGRQYAEQISASTSNEFEMEWTAPAAGTGDVSFYYCGNAVNLMSGTNGDNAICGKMSLSEDGVMSSINAPDAKVALDIFPNPVGDVMHLKTTTEQSGIYSAVIFNQTGKAVLTRDFDVPTGEQVNFLEVSNLSSGYYNLVLTDENGDAVSKKIIKQ